MRLNHKSYSHVNTLHALHLNEWGAGMFPAYLRDEGLRNRRRRNPASSQSVSERHSTILNRIGADVEDLFHHVLAVLHDPARIAR